MHRTRYILEAGGLEKNMAQTESLVAPEHAPAFVSAARQFDVYILVRAANPQAFRFYNKSGYYPKRLDIKAKTAKTDLGKYVLAGLVVSPEVHPGAFGDRDKKGVLKNWEQSLDAIWIPKPGETRAYLPAGKRYSVEMNPEHRHYGVLAYHSTSLLTQKLYVCGDYDLYGLVSAKNPAVHYFVTETMLNNNHVRTPELRDVQYYLNRQLGMALIQHGAQESYLEHQDEPVVVFTPDGKILLLENKAQIEKFYQEKLGGRKAFDSKHPENASSGPGLWKRP